jgi:1-acyl-sn-glycerol-3-phosphate acyltransferase
MAFVRLLAFIGLTLPLMPLQALAVLADARLARRLPRFYHRIACRIIGLEVVVGGAPQAAPPTLFVGNHVSYLDIPALASVLEGSFVAKAEIARWPFFGWLARLQRTVFIERRAHHAARHRDSIAARLGQGDNLILFPEGTSNDGNRVLPFKSALFSVAENQVDGRPLTVQPFSIAYTRLGGLPMDRASRPLYAWYGDMELPGHAWRVLGLGRVRVDVVLHPPLTLAALGSRKALADHCQRVVAEGAAAALAGRLA